MPNPAPIHVTDSTAGQTLAAVLRAASPHATWSEVRKQVAQSCVRVNQVVCLDSARRLKSGDVIEIGHSALPQHQLKLQIRMLHVDHHLAVIDKPSGLLTERRPEEKQWSAKRKSVQPTLDELLPGLLRRGRSATRRDSGGVILVHRLDRDTSGVMVVARTAEAAHGLTAQFRQHSAERVYRAVVVGHPGMVTIQSLFVRDRGDGVRGSAEAPVGKLAITHVREVERIGPYCVVECRLETGRTNQIRIHLAEKNCLVCGDVKYHKRLDGSVIPDPSQAPRLALHAAELRFVHPVTQQALQFLSPWPPDLEKFVTQLRSQAPPLNAIH